MPLSADAIEPVLAAVEQQRGIDFRDYRPDTILRGISARMSFHAEADVAGYLRTLEQDQDEMGRLLETLVVPWSSFFRDPRVFAALDEVVLPRLAFHHLERRPLRAWCVGTGTGEEVWSLAMLLAAMAARPAGPAWELLASDLDQRSLDRAEQARYTRESAAAVPEPHHRRSLLPDGQELVVEPGLRQRVRFAQHDLLGPRLCPALAIIASFDLVLARNVLIYFDRRLQEKALDRLAATLEPGGALVLGQVETLPPALQDRFEPFPGSDPDLRIFAARGA